MQRALAGAAITLMMLAGCSGGTPNSQPSTAPSTAPTTSTTPPSAGTRPSEVPVPTVNPSAPTSAPTNVVAAGDTFAANVQILARGDNKGRSMQHLKAAAKELGAKVTAYGIFDGNKDGLDDDGLVTLMMGEDLACVSFPVSAQVIGSAFEGDCG